ncbi:MAG: sec-independent protein translocase protein [Candidatus Saccharibacteria bacterium]|nr:sec-independent protein translocase protein [Candidatus Saccharibacteria bacterium]
MQLVDTHCHIQSAGSGNGERLTHEKWTKAPERTPEIIVADAVRAGVDRMICVGCDVNDSRLAVDFVQNHPETWASIGIHPHEAKRYVDDSAALSDFSSLTDREKVVAVGECGLDYYYGHSPQVDQAKILRYQIELALAHDKPMIFHVRDAFDDFWPIFDDYKGIRGVLHSFTDTEANLDKAMERGLHIGVNGIATFARDPDQLNMYKKVPLSRLLLETDAPFLTPSPYRGTICEPYHIKVIAEFLGGLREEAVSDLARVTTENAARLFKI